MAVGAQEDISTIENSFFDYQYNILNIVNFFINISFGKYLFLVA